MYSRIGDIVEVDGHADVAATASGAPVILRISLPIASNFVAYANCSGTATCLGAEPIAGAIRAPSDFADVAELYYKSDTTASTFVHFHFAYRVL